MTKKRVVVTGLGAITPLGNNVLDFWNAMLAGKSGASPITLFDTTHYKTKFACEVKNLDFASYFEKKEERKYDRCGKLGLIAAREGIEHSGLNAYTDLNKERVGVVFGSGIGGLSTFEEEVSLFYTRFNKVPRYNPFFIPKMIIDIIPGLISIENGYLGPNYSTVSACATSTNSIIDGYMLIKMNKADVMVVGGAEAAITSSGMGGFNALHALSTRNDEPEKASRPFDKDRDGFVLGEGAGCMILEELEHAKRRGANIIAELCGTGLTADAYHMTAPHPDGIGARNVMKQCVEEAGISPSDVDHINLHGTSTPLGDVAECKAVASYFEDNLENLLINSTKSMTGHLLGAAGIVESIASILSINNNIVPPTINLDNLDESIDARLNIVSNKPQNKEVNIAISNTFGFGGHNASVLFKRY